MWANDATKLGYEVIPGIVGQTEIARLLEEIKRANLIRSRAGVRHAMRLPAVVAIARDGRLLRIAQAVVGNEAIPFRATLFEESPATNWLVVWHQDTALPLQERKEMEGWGPWSVKDGITYAHAPAAALEKVVALRLHLDDSNLDKGPLRVLPKTHESGVLTDEEIHKFSEIIQAVDCPVPKGGVVAMRPLVIHASSKSATEEPRRVLHIAYAANREILPGMALAIA